MIRVALLLLWLVAVPVFAGVGPIPAQGRVEVLFAPHDPVENRLLALIAQARKTIHVQMYAFTRKSIARALVDAQARGVTVQVLADARLNQRGDNALPILLAAGVPVALETEYRAAHNKIMLIDAALRNNVVITGSYNFSWSASQKNAENVLILYANRPLTDAYLANWQRHFDVATHIRTLPRKLVD